MRAVVFIPLSLTITTSSSPKHPSTQKPQRRTQSGRRCYREHLHGDGPALAVAGEAVVDLATVRAMVAGVAVGRKRAVRALQVRARQVMKAPNY